MPAPHLALTQSDLHSPEQALTPSRLPDLLAALHSIAIRNAGNKAITARASSLIQSIKMRYRPEGRPGHHRDLALISRRTARELDALLKGRAHQPIAPLALTKGKRA